MGNACPSPVLVVPGSSRTKLPFQSTWAHMHAKTSDRRDPVWKAKRTASAVSKALAWSDGLCYRRERCPRLGAREGPGKAVQIRRDPVTVTGDETRDGHWPQAGKARGVE